MAAADDDFDDLMDDIDFDMGNSKSKSSGKPKDVVFGTGLDVAKGIKDSLNPLDKIPDIVRELMPNAVKSEYSDLESALSEIKEETSKGIDDVKKSLKEVSKSIADLFPEGNIKNKLKEFGSSDDYPGETKTKEEEEREKINQALMEALGEASSEEKQRDLIKEAVAEQREANSQKVLKHIYAEMSISNKFAANITEKYYRKSLELQYKQLYKTAELVELTKVGWESNRKQIESIIINTSLPDLIKLKALQATNDPRLRERAKSSYLGKYFRKFNPFENLKNNIVKNIQQQVSQTKEALEMALMGADSAKMAKEMLGGANMGMTPGMLIGGWLGNSIRSSTLGNLGERLSRAKQGEKFVYNFKNFTADPRNWLKNMAGRGDNKTMFGKLQNMGFDFLSRMAGSPDKKRVDFVNENLDDAKAFDGRVHQAIVKVIPSLLTDIRGILKSGLKVSDEDIKANAVYFDNKSGRFMSAMDLKKNITSDISTAVNKDGFRMYAEQLFSMLENTGGVALDKSEKQAAVKGIAAYMMDTNLSSINPDTITQKAFLEKMGKAKSKMLRGAGNLILAGKHDYYVYDDIKNALDGMRSNLPNMNNRLRDLHKSGYMDIAGDLGMVTQDSYTGNWATNNEGVDKRILNAVGSIDFDNGTIEGAHSKLNISGAQAKLNSLRNFGSMARNKLSQSELGRKAMGFASDLGRTRTAGRIKGLIGSIDSKLGITSKYNRASQAINDWQDKLVAFADQDAETIKDQIASGKVKLQQMISKEAVKGYSVKVRKEFKAKLNEAQQTVTSTVKDLHKKAKNLTKEDIKNLPKAAKEQAIKYYKEAEKEIAIVSKDFVQDANDLGLTNERIEEYKAKVKQVKEDAENKIKNDPRIKKAKDYVTSTKAYKKSSVIGGFIGSKLGGIKSRLFGKAAGLFGGKAKAEESGEEEASVMDVDVGNDGQSRALKDKKRRELDNALRENSAQNQQKKMEKALSGEDKTRKRSSFITKAGAKAMLAGGIGFLAISLLKKLGFGMEDFIAIGKGIWAGIKAVGSVIGTVARAIKRILGIFGIGSSDVGPDDPNEISDQIEKDKGFSMAGLAGNAIAIGGTALLARSMWRGLPGKIIRGGNRAGKWVGKTGFKAAKWMASPAPLFQPGAGRGLGAVGKGAKAAGGGLLRGAGRLAMGAGRRMLPFMGLYGAASMIGGIGTEGYGVTDAAMDTAMMASNFSGVRNWVSDKFSKVKNFGKKLWNKIPSPSDVKKSIEDVGKQANRKFNKRTAKRALARIAKKVGVKLATLAAGAATAAAGIGILISAISIGMLIYDVYQIGSRWVKGLSLKEAVSDYYLGANIFDDNVTDLPPDPMDAEIETELAVEEAKAKDDKEKQKQIENTANSISPSSQSATTSFSSASSNTYSSANDMVSQATANSYTPPPVSNYKRPTKFKYDGIGSMSAWFESRANPGIVSSGAGDYGGASYGAWQLASNSNVGTLQNYLKASKYGREFEGLRINSPEFKAKWVEIANRDPAGFLKDQEDFIKRTHYDPVVRNLKTRLGLDVEKRSDALKSTIFSVSVSLGTKMATNAITNALASRGLNPATANDEEIISAIYDYEAANVASTYRSSSYSIQESRRKRAMSEKGLALSLLSESPNKGEAPKTTVEGGAPVEPTAPAQQAPSAPVDSQFTKVSTQSDSELGTFHKASYETTKRGDSSITNVSQVTNTGIGNIVITLKQQLDIQNKMNENLIKIVANTEIFGQYAKAQQEASKNQPTQMPSPVINLERREDFTGV